MVSVSVRGIGGASRAVSRVQRLAQHGVVRILQKQRDNFVIWCQVVSTWVSPPGYYAPHDRGGFFAAWRSRGFPRGVILHNDRGVYSQVLEVGRRVGAKAPPHMSGNVGPLQGWIRRKFPGLSPAQIRSFAWHLGKAIKRRGQKPRLVATNALEGIADIAERAIAREIDSLLSRI